MAPRKSSKNASKSATSRSKSAPVAVAEPETATDLAPDVEPEEGFGDAPFLVGTTMTIDNVVSSGRGGAGKPQNPLYARLAEEAVDHFNSGQATETEPLIGAPDHDITDLSDKQVTNLRQGINNAIKKIDEGLSLRAKVVKDEKSDIVRLFISAQPKRERRSGDDIDYETPARRAIAVYHNEIEPDGENKTVVPVACPSDIQMASYLAGINAKVGKLSDGKLSIRSRHIAHAGKKLDPKHYRGIWADVKVVRTPATATPTATESSESDESDTESDS